MNLQKKLLIITEGKIRVLAKINGPVTHTAGLPWELYSRYIQKLSIQVTTSWCLNPRFFFSFEILIPTKYVKLKIENIPIKVVKQYFSSFMSKNYLFRYINQEILSNTLKVTKWKTDLINSLNLQCIYKNYTASILNLLVYNRLIKLYMNVVLCVLVFCFVL